MEKEIISDFYQGKVTVRSETKTCLDDNVLGNCVTIALIKAALVTFNGKQPIFLNYSTSNNTINVTFRDNLEVSVTTEDINMVKEISGIKPSPEAKYYEDAIELYALIAKRVYIKKDKYAPQCITDFKTAVEYLNCGFPTVRAPELLALKKTFIRKRNIRNYKSVIIRTGAHASYCSFGTQDILGKANTIWRVLGVWWMKNPIGIGGIIREPYILKS